MNKLLTVIIMFLLLIRTCHGQINLTWGPSPSQGVAGYNICYGTNSEVNGGIYTFTNTYNNSQQTNCTISNLIINEVYYFAAQSFWSNGICGPFGNEIQCTNFGLLNSTNVGIIVNNIWNDNNLTWNDNFTWVDTNISVVWNDNNLWGDNFTWVDTTNTATWNDGTNWNDVYIWNDQ